MILALEEDSVLRVYDSPEHAAQCIEPLDAEETFRALFDENARPYRIEWIEPNKEGLFGLENGKYRLVAAGDPDETGLLQSIRKAVAIEPQSAEKTIRELERRITHRST